MGVSVIIPLYNRAIHVGRAVDSVLAQTMPVEEILVVNDGSDDNPEEQLAKYKTSVRVINHDSNAGAAAARNTGIKESKNEYIAFLDSDDIWMPEKIERQMSFMAETGMSVSCTGFNLSLFGLEKNDSIVAKRPYGTSLSISDIAWGCYTSPGSTMICSRALLNEVGGYDASFPRYEDWDLLIRLMAIAPKGIGFLNIPLANIEYTNRFSAADAFEGLERIFEKHQAQMASRYDLDRQFRAAIAFNRAAVHKAMGEYFCTAANLLTSLMIHPRRHFPIKHIFPGSLFRRRLYLFQNYRRLW